MSPELQEIYDYELLNGNVVETIEQNELQEINSIMFKFPLRYDADRIVNQIMLCKSISEIMNFDKKSITYYSPQKDQKIVAPFDNTDIHQILHEANLRYSEEYMKFLNIIPFLVATAWIVVITLIFILAS